MQVLKGRDAQLALSISPPSTGPTSSTNAIESTFATVKLRTRKTKGSGSRTVGLAMAYMLRWHAGAASMHPHLVALVPLERLCGRGA